MVGVIENLLGLVLVDSKATVSCLVLLGIPMLLLLTVDLPGCVVRLSNNIFFDFFVFEFTLIINCIVNVMNQRDS